MLVLPFVLVPDAAAGIYGGNPGLYLKIDRPPHDLTDADVTIWKVRVNTCGGGYTDYVRNATVDLTSTYTFTIQGGDLCGVRVYWDSPITMESSTFVIEYDADYTDVWVTGGSALAPFTVVSGVIYGGNPELLLDIH